MKSQHILTTILVSTYISSSFAVKAINDTELYPVCIADSDCEKNNLDGHACFQYFCYPWKKEETEVKLVIEYLHCYFF